MRNSGIGFVFLIVLLANACVSKKELPVSRYYEYDHGLPLEDSVSLIDSTQYSLFKVEFTSVHNKRVTGLLTIPESIEQPVPVVILLHGVGDRKTVDYIEAGHQYFVEAGYAVLRIDVHNHGDRTEHKYDFELIDGYRYWTRDIIIQTVFDLRRSIDFLETRPEIDSERVGLFGISLGGIIGTIFSGVDERVKAPVIALAGGNLTLMFGMDALKDDTKDFFSMIDPINFVEFISPRPLLMINAENDEVIAPITSKMLYQAAGEPKEIIWYPSRHRNLPIEKAYPNGIDFYNKYLSR
ncbi:MAG: alpha/beta hydrolase [Bacteroidota bacterium]